MPVPERIFGYVGEGVNRAADGEEASRITPVAKDQSVNGEAIDTSLASSQAAKATVPIVIDRLRQEP